MKDFGRFHDPQFDADVARVHDFVSSEIGPVMPLDHIVVVPPELAGKLSAELRRPVTHGLYLYEGRWAFALATTAPVVADSADNLSLQERIAHELGHDYSKRGAHGVHPVFREALAGTVEKKYLDHLVATGERTIPPGQYLRSGDATTYFGGEFIPYLVDELPVISSGLLAASGIYLAAKVSGVTPDQILASSAKHFPKTAALCRQTVDSLYPDTFAIISRHFPETANGIEQASFCIQGLAVNKLLALQS